MSPFPNFGLLGVAKIAVESKISLSSIVAVPRLRSLPDPVTRLLVVLEGVMFILLKGVSWWSKGGGEGTDCHDDAL